MFAEGLKTNLPTDLLRTLVTVCEFQLHQGGAIAAADGPGCGSSRSRN